MSPHPVVTGFYREHSILVCDGVSLADIAGAAGTPVYVYSAESIRRAYRDIDQAFGSYPHALHYALKANSTLAIARLLRDLGSGADANSGGEIEIALRAGFRPSQITFTGVGKTEAELQRAVAVGVASINAESPGELERIDAVARAQGRRARVALRINPDIDPLSHPHISTGLKTNKFGMPIQEARAIYRQMRERQGLALIGVHMHIGSQILNLEPLRRAAAAVVTLAGELRQDGVELEHLDLGGGLGISYNGSQAPSPAEYAAALLKEVHASGLAVVLEPGRVIAGPAGALVARIVDLKEYPGGKRFAVVDCGMTELLRPALYGAFHRIESIASDNPSGGPYDIVGPLCESSDMLGRDRPMPPLKVGDLLAVLDAGAYGAAMASNYNRRPLPAEVLVDAGAWRVIRRRQTLDDMVALEET